MIDLTNIFYIAFRLAPFILVCFFVLESILNWDLKGIIYLFGLLVTCSIVVMSNAGIHRMQGENDQTTGPNGSNSTVIDNLVKCNTFAIGPNGEKLSKYLPLSTAVFSYTFFYLLIFIVGLASNAPKGMATPGVHYKLGKLNSAMQQNAPTMIIFPLLIIIDLIWNMMSGCAKIQYIVATILLSGVMGIIWGLIISSTGNAQLQYINRSDLGVCSRPSKTLYRCKPKKITT